MNNLNFRWFTDDKPIQDPKKNFYTFYGPFHLIIYRTDTHVICIAEHGDRFSRLQKVAYSKDFTDYTEEQIKEKYYSLFNALKHEAKHKLLNLMQNRTLFILNHPYLPD